MTNSTIHELIPVVPMQTIVQQYCIAKGLPFQVSIPAEMDKAFEHYCLTEKYLN